MTDLRKAAEMALEALNDDPKMLGDWLDNLKTAREALRQALAQPQPVQFKCTVVDDGHPNGVPLSQWGRQPEQGRLTEITRQFVGIKDDGSERWVETEYRTKTRSEWVGLTEEESIKLLQKAAKHKSPDYCTAPEMAVEFGRLASEALKEKNT